LEIIPFFYFAEEGLARGVKLLTGLTLHQSANLSTLPTLKGQCHEIFCFWLSMNHLPPKPMIIAAGVNNTDDKFATQRHRRQICHQYSKFATGVTNNGNTFRLPTP
jgi:hypothetical protein